MKYFAVLCGAAFLALLSTGCNQAAPDTRAADTQALKDLEAGWNQEWAAKDGEKVIAHYADDAVLMTPGADPVSGKDAIKTGLTEMLKDPALSLKFQTLKVEVSKSGDVGYTQGSYTLSATDSKSKKPVTDHGSYVTTYRKGADGGWKAVADIASSGAPPAPPPAKPGKK